VAGTARIVTAAQMDPGNANDSGPPLRIHFLVSFSHASGTYFRFHNLAIALNRRGHDVRVFAASYLVGSPRRKEVRDGIPYELIPETILNRVTGVNCDPVTVFRRWASRRPPCDVAHLFQPFPSAAVPWLRGPARARFYDWDDLWYGGLMRGPVGRWREHWTRGCVRYFEQRLPRWADHVTAISQYLADLARARGAHAVTVLNSGSWPAEPQPRSATRTRLGLRSDAFYVGFMGRNANELPWCFDGLAQNMERHPRLRLAICGMPESYLTGLPAFVRERVDYLGQLPPADATAFAGCLDLGLLPLQKDQFNLSRLPQKFGDHLATGVPLLCSSVGECGLLIGRFPWAISAGSTRAEWLAAFQDAVERLTHGDIPSVDRNLIRDVLSWDGISRRLAQLYRTVLAERTPKAA
jgi:glycosyltransferase involved in cell wall biosynthesis